MAHIDLPEGLPGISGPLAQYPETAQHLLGLAQVLLRGPSSLTPQERELIAVHVSNLNECEFCVESHSAAARFMLGPAAQTVDLVRVEGDRAPVSPKLRALLTIAGKVQGGGRSVTEAEVAAARAEGADDQAIHHTVLIAAAFCMYNRYVDGLATWLPPDVDAYREMGESLGTHGYTPTAMANGS
ncbi:carboxymuconolactone decarboxylase family protein [Micromonospora sp. NBC_01699]|uniref:carboxymuconolactone decarboxylase family protein n=1 Tax=Micromonospora sp. NBC_01699 TaxID=2975984 RepID=UPI002E32B471|nr:carboxymuconolactone decarboxylase family protein [Micromonospora sp. NBC_01699]